MKCSDAMYPVALWVRTNMAADSTRAHQKAHTVIICHLFHIYVKCRDTFSVIFIFLFQPVSIVLTGFGLLINGHYLESLTERIMFF